MPGSVLIVEDDTNMRENIAMFLEQAGYHVTQASDGETALELLTCATAQNWVYDVVVTDIVMGNVDGLQVMTHARKQPSQPEVILLTGHGSVESAVAAIRTHAFDYLLKPCRITTLLERVAAAIEYHSTQQRIRREAEQGRKFSEFASQIQSTAHDEYRESKQPSVIPVSEETSPPPKTSSSSPQHHDTYSKVDEATTQQQHISDSSLYTERFIQIGLLCIDTHRYEVWFDDVHIEVTPTEYALLYCLALRPGRACTFAEITNHTHGQPLERSDAQQLLGTHVRNLRKKFDRRYLVSVRGVGYMLVSPDE